MNLKFLKYLDNLKSILISMIELKDEFEFSQFNLFNNKKIFEIINFK